MATTLRLNNYSPTNTKEPSTLAVAGVVGQQQVTLVSTAGFNIGDTVILGKYETAEKLQIGAVAGEVISFSSPLLFAHKIGARIIAVKGDKFKIYRAPNSDGRAPNTSFFTLLSTLNIDVDDSFTDYTDTSGNSNYWYRYTFFNSFSGAESSLADSKSERGGGYGRYITIDEIRTEAGFTGNVNISDQMINSRRIDAEDEINTALAGIYTLPFSDPVPRTVVEINRLIAAGLLLLTEYGAVSTGSNKEGNDKIKQGRDLLTQLQARTKTLVDATGQTLAVTSGVRSWPNDTTDGLSEYDDTGNPQNGGGFMFRADHRY